MISRLVRPCLAALIVSLAANTGHAQPPPPPATDIPAPTPAPVSTFSIPQPDELVQLQLPDADLDTVLQTLELFTGRTVLSPAQIPMPAGQRINLRIKNPIPKSEAVLIILTTLSLNQVAVVPQGERTLIVAPLSLVRTATPEMIEGSTLGMIPSGKIAMKLFQLDFARAPEVQAVLGNILTPTVSGMVPLNNANALMITDTIANLQRVERILLQLDQPNPAGIGTKFYVLRNGAKASDVVSKLSNILRTVQPQLGTVTSYSADDRTNQIVLVTDPRQFPIFDQLIEQLDTRADPNNRTDTIYLKHAKAVDMVTVLNNVISKQTAALQRQNPQSLRPGQIAPPNAPAAPGAPPAALPAAPALAVNAGGEGGGSAEFSQIMTVVADERSNAIVVSGTADDFTLIRQLIDKLDIVLPQVRIEVVVAEVTLDDNNASGISALGLKLDGDRLVGFSGTEATIGVTNGVITRPGTSGGFDLAADIAIGSTPRKNNTTILTVPAIVTAHGKKGLLTDGETRPVITGTTSIPGAASGTQTVSQIQQQQIGTTLTVTPFIGAEGFVTLDIEQELTDVTGTVIVDGNTQYVIGKRGATQSISARSGDIIVLGGFRKKIDSKSRNRLGPIPFLGDLFGSRKRQNYYQELIFFLRPSVLTNNPETDNAEAYRRVEQLPTKEQIKELLDPNYQPPPQTFLEKVIPGGR